MTISIEKNGTKIYNGEGIVVIVFEHKSVYSINCVTHWMNLKWIEPKDNHARIFGILAMEKNTSSHVPSMQKWTTKDPSM